MMEVTPAQRFVESVIAAYALSEDVDELIINDFTLGRDVEAMGMLERQMVQIEAALKQLEETSGDVLKTHPAPHPRSERVDTLWEEYKGQFVASVRDMEARIQKLEQRQPAEARPKDVER
jgi:hypothetical protein